MLSVFTLSLYCKKKAELHNTVALSAQCTAHLKENKHEQMKRHLHQFSNTCTAFRKPFHQVEDTKNLFDYVQHLKKLCKKLTTQNKLFPSDANRSLHGACCHGFWLMNLL